MATWLCHQHQAVVSWINEQARAGHAGLRASFDSACQLAEDESSWEGRTGNIAYVRYKPGNHPLVYPMLLKIDIHRLNIVVVGVVLPREKIGFDAAQA